MFLALAAVPFATGPATTPIAGIAPLDGTAWTLLSLAGSAPVAHNAAVLQFSKGRVQGSDGCNRYSGSYRVGPQELQIGPDLIATQMACPPAIMEQASAYTRALFGARSYRISAAQLQLLSAHNTVLATFVAQPQSAQR